MKKIIPSFLLGVLVGAAMLTSVAAAATGILASRSPHTVMVDGERVEIEGYLIEGHNYYKLRDIGQAVGFNVYWLDGVQVDSDAPYTGEAPRKEVVNEATLNDEGACQEIVDLTNDLRREHGLPTLSTNEKLMEAAQVRAEEMAAAGVYSHTRPDGRKYTTVTDCPYVAENIHQIPLLYLKQQNQGLAETVVELWSNSAGHAKNMTDSRYGSIGVGIAKGVDSNGLECWYCVQLFLRSGYTVKSVDAPAA